MKSVIILPEAEMDIDEATRWYASQQARLGDVFIDDIEHALQQIAQHEYIGPTVHRSVRRYLLRRFPYGIFYRVEDEAIYLIAVPHARQSPTRWKFRERK